MARQKSVEGYVYKYTYTPNTGFNGTDSFQYQDSDNNGTKSNFGTISIVLGSSVHNLVVHIKVANDTIVRGNIQTITVIVRDDTSRNIAGANVQGEVTYVTGHQEPMSGITDGKWYILTSMENKWKYRPRRV